jgi:hypothetical protein
MKNIFEIGVVDEIINRINSLTPESKALWGKMHVAQMLAHCNVTYELVYTNKHPKPNFLISIILKLFVKKIVTNDTPYKRSSQTAPFFKITDPREFEFEKEKLVENIRKTQGLGINYFNNKPSHSFGVLTINEWNNLFYKHLDHHLSQFNV